MLVKMKFCKIYVFKDEGASFPFWNNGIPAILCKVAVPEQMHWGFFSTMVTIWTDCIIEVHALSLKQRPSTDPAVSQRPDENLVFEPARGRPNHFENWMSFLISHQLIVHTH